MPIEQCITIILKGTHACNLFVFVLIPLSLCYCVSAVVLTLLSCCYFLDAIVLKHYCLDAIVFTLLS